ncbi:MAG: LPS translocon maturation chaperone LptM [Gammaproteobacteria bacterium]
MNQYLLGLWAVILVAGSLMLYGCGYKGSLRLPAPPQEAISELRMVSDTL